MFVSFVFVSVLYLLENGILKVLSHVRTREQDYKQAQTESQHVYKYFR